MIVVLTLILSSCNFLPYQPSTPSYEIKNIEPTIKDISISSQFDRLSSLERPKICFNIINNGQTTLVSKVDIMGNTTCFNSISTKSIGEIAPGNKPRECVDISLNYNLNQDQSLISSCQGKTYEFNLILRDITGNELARGSTSMNLVR